MESAATTTEEQKPEFEDLAAYKIPLPVMLGARTLPGDAQPAETMTAEAAAEDGVELAMVPVPGLRPQGTPAGITVDRLGRLWIVEDRNRSVLVVAPDAPKKSGG